MFLARGDAWDQSAGSGCSGTHPRQAARPEKPGATPSEIRFTLGIGGHQALPYPLASFGLKPYRRHGRSQTAVLLKIVPSLANNTLQPEFTQLGEVLMAYISTRRPSGSPARRSSGKSRSLRRDKGDGSTQGMVAPSSMRMRVVPHFGYPQASARISR